MRCSLNARLLDARVRAEAAPRQSLVARFGLVPHTNGMQQDHPAYRERASTKKATRRRRCLRLKGCGGACPEP